MSSFAIRNPYLIVVLCLVIVILGGVATVMLPVDLFPKINIPVVVVATFYSGMPPQEIEADISSRFERYFTLADGIDRIESRSLAGVSLVKLYFQPGTNADSAASNVASIAMSNLRRLPQGTLPPVVMKFDASSLPVCLVTARGEGLSEAVLRDIVAVPVRNQVAGVPGASIAQPFGGRTRQIMIYAEPAKLEAFKLSPMDVVRAINDSNVVLPAGDVRIGPIDYNLYSNSMIENVRDINSVPIKRNGSAMVTIGDIGVAKDAEALQYNIVRIDGQRSVYFPVLKQGGDANTIAVVDGVRNKLKHMVDVPPEMKTDVVFDQSLFVKSSIETLLHEGGIGLILTSIMVLLFLGSFRATIAVCLSIPLSALATFLALGLGGNTINTMVLGGLALAFSRIIDNSVIVLENIYRHLELGATSEGAAEEGGREVTLPVLAATLTTVVVFFPVVLLYGVSKFLFTALALAVILSLFASYAVALTVVPVFAARFIKPHATSNAIQLRIKHGIDGVLDFYERIATVALRSPKLVLLVALAAFALSFLVWPRIGQAFFPRTDAGQFVANVKAPTGTRLEDTEKKIAKVEEIIRRVVDPKDLDIIVSNIGITPEFPAIYSQNTGQHSSVVQTAFKEDHKIGSYEYMRRVRKAMSEELPELDSFVQSGGLVDSVLNMGVSAPIDIQVSSSDILGAHRVAGEIAARVRALPEVEQVFIPQDVDSPVLKLHVDRVRAAAAGLLQREVVSNVITALTSNQMIGPGFWVDPKSGRDYLLTVQYAENRIRNLVDLRSIPLHAAGSMDPVRLDTVADLQRTEAPIVIDHQQLRPVIDVYVQTRGEDLARAGKGIQKIVASTKIPGNMAINVRGMIESMTQAFRSFALGLVLSVVLLFLILVAQFRSFKDPFIIMLAIPPGLSGVLFTLAFTSTTLNVQSLLGVLMMVGIVVSNSILIVEFTHHLRREGMSVEEAVLKACRIRLRPVLMTSIATLLGLLPMALAIGTGSEAYAPLARAILGGLTVSLVATVFVVPCAYLLIYRGKEVAA